MNPIRIMLSRGPGMRSLSRASAKLTRGKCEGWRIPRASIGETLPTRHSAHPRFHSTAMSQGPLVAVIMGSKSDWETMKHTAELLEKFGISHESRVVSAHRTPDLMADYAKSA